MAAADLACRSPRDGWAILMGGGSLARVRPLPPKLARIVPDLVPVDNEVAGDYLQCLANTGRDYLVYSANHVDPVELRLELPTGRYRVQTHMPESPSVGHVCHLRCPWVCGAQLPTCCDQAKGVQELSRADASSM